MNVLTGQKRQVIDITEQIEAQLGNHSGAVLVFVKHTTAAITTADLDPGTDLDLLDALEGLLPKRQWRHPHNPEHAPDHLLSSIVGPGLTIPCRGGKLQLGSWQRLILIELDGPRSREIEITLLAAA